MPKNIIMVIIGERNSTKQNYKFNKVKDVYDLGTYNN